MNAQQNTVSISELEKSLKEWTTATTALLRTLKANYRPKPNRSGFIKQGRKLFSKKNKLTDPFTMPLQQFVPFLELSLNAGAVIKDSIQNTTDNILPDLWDTWAALICRALAAKV